MLNFVDFVSEMAVEAKVVACRNEDSNSYILEETTSRIYQKCNICHTSQKFQIFPGKTFISRGTLLPSVADFPKMGHFPTI